MKPLPPKVPSIDGNAALAVAKWYGLEKGHDYGNALFTHIEGMHALKEADRWGAVLVAKLLEAGWLKDGGDPAEALQNLLNNSSPRR